MKQLAKMEGQPRSVLISMAERYGMETAAFEATLRATVVPPSCTREQFAAFLLVAQQYDLNPVLKEIYAFPARGGGIQPIVSIDGWMNLINSRPEMDGLEFDDHLTHEGGLTAITARIWRKDRAKPTVITEYMSECLRDTDIWRKYPRRMLRHKAAIQCARYAFGFSGIIDPDEAERAGTIPAPVEAHTPPPAPPPSPRPQHTIHIPESRQGRGRRDKPPEAPESLDHMQGHDGEDLHSFADFAAAAETPGPADSEQWSKVTQKLLADAKTEAQIEMIDRTQIQPVQASMFPGDRGDVERARDKALERVREAT